ncbi:MAG: HAMP domain-containing protein [Sulfurisoma sp.]|nr:HAMP domain-containing protein [Sulfurisoma sp.]
MKTINRYLLVSLAAALVLVAVLVAAVSYVLFGRQASEQELLRRQAMTEERARAEIEPFMQALRRLELARDDALARLDGTRKADSPIRFGHDTAARDDGSVRSHVDRFDPKWEPGIFVPSNVTADEDLKHCIVAFRDTANLFGQAWRKDWPNLWFAGREGWIVAYWPAYPWTEKLKAADKPAAEPWFARAAPEKNPGKGPVWGAPRSDPDGKGTSVVLSLPLYAGDTFLGVIAQDVPLARLADAVAVDEADAGIARIVFAADGALLAMSGRTAEIAKAGGSLKAAQVPAAASAIAAIQAHGEAFGRVRDAAGKQHVLYSGMGKLPWTLATLVPDARLGGGLRAALGVGAAGLMGLLLVLALMARQLRVALVKPLRQLSAAVASITNGHADVVLPTGARGEIAELADALIPMRDSVAAKLKVAKEEKSALATRLAEAEQKAEQTQRRLDEETVVAEDRASRLKDLEQRYEALLQQQLAPVEGEDGGDDAELAPTEEAGTAPAEEAGDIPPGDTPT